MRPENSGSYNDLDPNMRKAVSEFIREEVRSQVSRQFSNIREKREEDFKLDERHIEYGEKPKVSEDTGPIDTARIRELTQKQKRQNDLNAKQQAKHERKVAYVENEPIRFTRLRKSFKFAFQGFIYVWKTQPNMKIHTIAAALAIIMGFVFHISAAEWLSIILVIGLVIMLEVINTAIETLVDLYTEDFSFLAGISKDLGATTVLIMAITSIVVGLVVFLPKILALFGS